MFSKKEEVKSIGNPAGIGKGTGFGLRERDRDGIGLRHYRLRTNCTELFSYCAVRVGPFFQDRTGSVFSFFKGDFSLKKDTLFTLPVITPACCYKSSGSILIFGCIYFFFK